VAAADPIAVQPNQPEERNASLTARPRISTPHPPFPLADKIALGTGEDAVTSAYGTPSAWAVTSEDGQIVETLVYALEREHLETVIRIVDGKVAAVYTKAPPASPRGSLIRTLGQ
jgi:hypothetical protein